MTRPKTSQPPVAETDDLDASSIAAIRSLLAEETNNRSAVSAVSPQDRIKRAFAPLSGGKAPVSGAERRDAADVMPEVAREALPLKQTKRARLEEVQVEDAPRKARRPAAIKGRLQGFRPTPRHLILASLMLVAFFRPWLVLGVLVLFTFVMVGVFLILGYDGFWLRAMAAARWYARRRPARAARLHAKLDRFAMRWDAVLDRFPEGTVDGLYLPDFGQMAQAEVRHDAALDRRFEKLRETQG